MTLISAVVSRSRCSISSRSWCFSAGLRRCARLRRFRPNRMGSLPASGGASAPRAASTKPAESATAAEAETSATPPSSAPIRGAPYVLHPEVVVPASGAGIAHRDARNPGQHDMADDIPSQDRAAARTPRPGSPHARAQNRQKEKDFSYQPRVGRTSSGRRGRPGAGRGGRPDQAGEFIDSRGQSSSVIPLSKTRRDDVADNPPRLRVRDLSFQPVANLDAYPSVLQSDHDENAIILVAFADAPLLKQPDRCVLDRPPPDGG